MLEKHLIIFVAHLDDVELSSLGYIAKHGKEYSLVKIIIASKWEKKERIFEENLTRIKCMHPKIEYINLEFSQRKFMSEFDQIKDKFYKEIPFGRDVRFDILTHGLEDCHTDHVAIAQISKGLFKYTNRYVTIYSPSSTNFNPNLWISLEDDLYEIKKQMCDKYKIENEQSYSNLGYYLESEEHYNIGRSYMLENFVHLDQKYCEIYRIEKWS